MTNPQALDADIDRIVEEITPDLIRIRRHLHMHPELSLQEAETAKLVAGELAKLGVEHRTGIGGHGIAALIGAGNGRVVGVRGDMDALPIEEKSGAPYASTVKGVSHACGHDAHTAIALGVARVMAGLSSRLPGRAFLVFQPAEEGFGGARSMVADGVLDWGRPDAMLGYHNWPPLAAGTVGFHPAAAFASSDRFTLTVKGQSGHGAYPHLARDPIVAAAQFIVEAQTIVAREVPPLEPAVVTFGKIEGGTAANQIPDTVTVHGTVRTHSEAVRSTIKAAIERLARGIGESHRVTCTLEHDNGVSSVVNDPGILAVMIDAAAAAVGEDKVVNLHHGTMGSEDFSEFSLRVPSAHLRIGSKLPDRQTMLHRSDFDLNEACIAVAVRCISRAAVRLMGDSRETGTPEMRAG